MKRNKEEIKNPTYFLILGFESILSGIGNIRYLINPDSIYDLIIGIAGAGAIIGSIILWKEYQRLA
ncbi:hypothetical protein [Niallia endozanthoxylica]|uniref:Uncharacterized protein n=1 Tax=Niallia endozanthoxylica TaxID=2036016 RepID=A0A5J5HS24_9BACI|nr:hypothetical protein [Niallia endozanthoxylica]KAA9023920.1 hypothetical protein F4V44_12345 [Niallia endozanthoxylica]